MGAAAPFHQCGNCDWTGPEDATDLADVCDLFERIDPGSEVPSGSCPECRALCYLIDNPYAPAPTTGNVEITVEGGCVTGVEGLPPGFTYTVKDFDVLDEECMRCSATGTPLRYKDDVWLCEACFNS